MGMYGCVLFIYEGIKYAENTCLFVYEFWIIKTRKCLGPQSNYIILH